MRCLCSQRLVFSILNPLNDFKLGHRIQVREIRSWKWPSGRVEGFEMVKEITSAEVLVNYDPEKPIFLVADTSSKILGKVSAQYVSSENTACPSKTLIMVDRLWLSSLVWGAFHQYLWGQEYVLCSDHKLLATVFDQEKTDFHQYSIEHKCSQATSSTLRSQG